VELKDAQESSARRFILTLTKEQVQKSVDIHHTNPLFAGFRSIISSIWDSHSPFERFLKSQH
jgi:hypothetical protein